MGDDQDGLADVVEEDHPVVEGEREVGQAAVVGRGVGQVLGVADRVVGGVADGPADEPGEARQVDGPVSGEQGLEVAERVVGRGPAGRRRGRAGRRSRTSRPRASKRRKGSVPRKLNRPTFSPPTTLSNRNEGADRSILRKAETGRQAVAGELAVDRDAGGLAGPPGEVLERRGDGRAWTGASVEGRRRARSRGAVGSSILAPAGRPRQASRAAAGRRGRRSGSQKLLHSKA